MSDTNQIRYEKKTFRDILKLVIDHRGKTPKKLGFSGFHLSGNPVLSARHVKTDSLVNVDAMRFANEEMYRKWMKVEIEEGDLILTSEAPMGEVFYLDGKTKYVLGQRVFGLRFDKSKVNPVYILSWLASKTGQNALKERATGSTVVGIKQSELLKIEIDLPPLERQNEVAKIRKNLTDKIQLNKETNQTLEAIAQALFKSWFIDFDPVRAKAEALAGGKTETQATIEAMKIISGKTTDQLTQLAQANPKDYQRLQTTAEAFPSGFDDTGIPLGWEVKSLDEIAHYQNGLALQKYRPEPDDDDFLPVVKIKQLKQGYADGEEKASIHIKPECIIDNGDVVFSWSGSLVVDFWCGGKSALNQHLFKVTSENYPKWFYYLYTCYHLAEFIRIANDKAVTMGHIKREHLAQAKCAVPNLELLENAEGLAYLLNKVIENRLENSHLANMRDALLPKLLSGEINP